MKLLGRAGEQAGGRTGLAFIPLYHYNGPGKVGIGARNAPIA